ncbi:MAG: type II toxin-antitoxin system prevent-host-death family antitoxin [Acidobacteriota bacterium]
MVVVSSRELKNRLGKYLSLVRAGQTLQVTDRGRPVACILPAAAPRDRQTAELLAAVAAKGGISVGAGRLARKPKPTVLKPGKPVAEMIAEDRR